MSKADYVPIQRMDPSTANVAQLMRTFADVASLDPVPAITFAGGDIVDNYADDRGEALKTQLEAWAELWRVSAARGKTSLVVVPGNHELNKKVGDRKLPNLQTDRVWTAWVHDNGYDRFAGNGPTAELPNSDRLLDDQSCMNYSFDVGPMHLVVLNTDTRTAWRDESTGDTRIGYIPSKWLARDLALATRSRRIRHVVILGHRNLEDPPGARGDAPIEPDSRRAMLAAIRACPKVRAYICAHVHVWGAAPMQGAGGAWQICAGHGGSDLKRDWHPPGGRAFGFVTVNLHRSGAIGFTPYLRPAPVAPLAYFEGVPAPATPGPETLLSR